MKKHYYRKLRYGFEVISHIFGYGESSKHCTCCGYTGIFEACGHPPRYGALCPSCGSLERHRLLAFFDQKEHFFTGKEVLHFAPEPFLSQIISKKAKRYITSNLHPGKTDLTLDIEKIEQPNESWDTILCCHVLEHVDDRIALSELYRILRKNGQLLIMVPIIEGWDITYEDSAVTTKIDRKKHFGQDDHVRYYGYDFRDRLKNTGFDIQEYTAYGKNCTKYGFLRGEKFFVCKKLMTSAT